MLLQSRTDTSQALHFELFYSFLHFVLPAAASSQTEQTQSLEYLLCVIVFLFPLYCTTIAHHLASAIEDWASQTHFHCVYDKTHQLIAFWPEIRKRLDKSHWERVCVRVCVRGSQYNEGIEFTVDEDCTAGTFYMNLCLSRDHLPWLI